MSENHAIVFWNVPLSDLKGAITPGSVQVLNINPDDVPGLSAYFNGGFRVVSHTVSDFNGPSGQSLMVSLYLQREVQLPDTP